MGYDVHICKTRNWLESADQPITREEILNLVRTIPNFIVLEDDLIEMAGGALLSYDGTKITIKSPTEAQIVVVYQISEKLGALLVGDDQERYVLKKKYLNLFGPFVLKVINE